MTRWTAKQCAFSVVITAFQPHLAACLHLRGRRLSQTVVVAVDAAGPTANRQSHQKQPAP